MRFKWALCLCVMLAGCQGQQEEKASVTGDLSVDFKFDQAACLSCVQTSGGEVEVTVIPMNPGRAACLVKEGMAADMGPENEHLTWMPMTFHMVVMEARAGKARALDYIKGEGYANSDGKKNVAHLDDATLAVVDLSDDDKGVVFGLSSRDFRLGETQVQTAAKVHLRLYRIVDGKFKRVLDHGEGFDGEQFKDRDVASLKVENEKENGYFKIRVVSATGDKVYVWIEDHYERQ